MAAVGTSLPPSPPAPADKDSQFRTCPPCPPPSSPAPQPRDWHIHRPQVLRTARRRHRCSSPLVWVGFAFLAHVVGRGLAEVQPPHGDFGDLLWRQVDPEGWKTEGGVRTPPERRFFEEWPSPGLLHQAEWAQSRAGKAKRGKRCCGNHRRKLESVIPAVPPEVSDSAPFPTLSCSCLFPGSNSPTRTRPGRHSRDGVEGPFAAVRLRLLYIDRLVQGL